MTKSLYTDTALSSSSVVFFMSILSTAESFGGWSGSCSPSGRGERPSMRVVMLRKCELLVKRGMMS